MRFQQEPMQSLFQIVTTLNFSIMTAAVLTKTKAITQDPRYIQWEVTVYDSSACVHSTQAQIRILATQRYVEQPK